MREQLEAVIRRLEQAVLRNHRIVLSAITYAEMRFGAIWKKASPRQLVDAFCARLDVILPWDRAKADATAEVKAALTAAGTLIVSQRHGDCRTCYCNWSYSGDQ